MKLEFVVCNVCRDLERETSEYTITKANRTERFDLCQEHSSGLDELLDRGGEDANASVSRASRATKSKPPGTRTRTRRGGTPITTMEEIERRKRTSSTK